MTAAVRYGFDLNRDVTTLEAMVTHLKPYVYEKELFGMMPGSLPKLTLGGLLMRLNRLTQLAQQTDLLSERQRDIVAESARKFQSIRDEWRVAYEGKLAQELKSRLNALGVFLEECGEDLRRCSDGYPSAMEKRVMIEVIGTEMDALGILSDDQRSAVSGIDNMIRRVVEESDFIWDDRLRKVYTPDQYWFLYRIPMPPNRRANQV
jgi:hypothetical protein